MEQSDIDILMAQAVTALEQGHSSSTVLDELLKHIPPHLYDEIRKRFNREVVALSSRTKPEEKKEKPSMTVSEMLSSLTQGAIDKFKNLFKAKPDVANAVKEAGQVFVKYGITVHTTSIEHDDLGRLAPQIGLDKGKSKGIGR